MKCKKCGAENFDGVNFCDKCGTQLTNSQKTTKKKSIIVVAIVAVIAITIGIILSMQSGITNPLEHHLQLGYKYLQEGQYEEAILAFDKVISIDEKNIEARFGKIEAYVALGETDSAKKILDEILEIDTNNAKAKDLYSELMIDISSNYEIKMVRNDPSNPEAQAVIQCLDGENIVWEYETDKISRTELEPISDVYTDAEKVYFSEAGTLKALDKTNGKVLWESENVGWGNSMVIDEHNIYVAGYYGPNVVIVNKSGDELYRDEDEDYYWVYDLKIENNTLYVYYDSGDGGIKEVDVSKFY